MGGQGFVLLTPAFWRNDMTERRLVQPFDTVSTRGYAYWLVYPSERRLVPKIKRFREWLLDKTDRARKGDEDPWMKERSAPVAAE